MEIDWRLLAPLLALLVLSVFLTGPGMWSEKWGWGFLRGGEGRRARRDAPDR
jgi:hypothetical protein